MIPKTKHSPPRTAVRQGMRNAGKRDYTSRWTAAKTVSHKEGCTSRVDILVQPINPEILFHGGRQLSVFWKPGQSESNPRKRNPFESLTEVGSSSAHTEKSPTFSYGSRGDGALSWVGIEQAEKTHRTTRKKSHNHGIMCQPQLPIGGRCVPRYAV